MSHSEMQPQCGATISAAPPRAAVLSPAAFLRRDAPPSSLRTSTTIQRRSGLNSPDQLVTQPESLAVLGHYYDGEIATQPALALLGTQGVAFPDAWLAIGRAQNIHADMRAEGIVGERLGEEVRITTEAMEWWLQT